MRRILLFIFSISFAFSCAHSPQTSNQNITHQKPVNQPGNNLSDNELNLINRFPDKLWELSRSGIINYEAKTPGGGFGAKYTAANCVVDIYIYDAQLDYIPDNINDNVIINLFRETMRLIIDIYSKDEYENLVHNDGILKQIGNKKMWFMEMEFKSKGIERYSVLGMTVFEGKFFKFRITTPKHELNMHKYRANNIIKSIENNFFNSI